jgi:hypothetical protein
LDHRRGDSSNQTEGIAVEGQHRNGKEDQMKTLQIEVETKKNCKMLTTWGVWQLHPYPDIAGYSGSFKWRNGEGLFDQGNNPSTGLERAYKAVLLREGWTPETAKDSRMDYAGFEWDDCGLLKQTMPGAIIFRGKSLGETSAEIRPDQRNSAFFRVHGFDCAVGLEDAFLQEQIAPSLLTFVRNNAGALRAEAIEKIHAHFALKILDARKSIDDLEHEADLALTKLQL